MDVPLQHSTQDHAAGHWLCTRYCACVCVVCAWCEPTFPSLMQLSKRSRQGTRCTNRSTVSRSKPSCSGSFIFHQRNACKAELHSYVNAGAHPRPPARHSFRIVVGGTGEEKRISLRCVRGRMASKPQITVAKVVCEHHHDVWLGTRRSEGRTPSRRAAPHKKHEQEGNVLHLFSRRNCRNFFL